MKRILALIISVATVCAFASCDKTDEKSEAESSLASTESSQDTAGELIDGLYSASFEDFEFGVTEDNVYKSSFGGLKFTAPENYVFSTQEEILQMMNIGAEALGDMSELYAEVAKQTTVYDMMAKNIVTGDNIIVMYENLTAYGQNAATAYDENTYLDAMDAQFAVLNQNGLVYTAKERQNVTIGGKDFVKAPYTCNYETYGTEVEQTYYVAKNGDYMTAIIFTAGVAGQNTDLSAIESCFEAYSAE